jgi:hydrogenase 3 maturation protease
LQNRSKKPQLPAGAGVNDVERELRRWLEDAMRIAIAGIGNSLRSDDFVGMKIVQNMKGRVSRKVRLIECGTVPEGHIPEILDFKPTHILVIDAASLGEPYGTASLVEDLKAARPAVSTHILPLQTFCGYLRDAVKAKVALLAIQPKKIEFGEGLTPEVADSAEKISRILVGILAEA